MADPAPLPLSVVIPTLDAAGSLPATLAALQSGEVGQLLVADGGSRDDTLELARKAGAEIVSAERGRGQQLAAGASAATQDWLLFLHADTRLGNDWAGAVRDFMADPENHERAAVFRLVLDDPDPRARRIERLASWRGRRLGLPYGDQGLLISKAFYDRLGGYRPLILMEDVDLARRIGRRRLAMLEAEALTSAGRYRRDGWWLRPLRNLGLLSLYYLGLPPRLLARLYG